MAADSRGPRNQPIFSGSGASADAEDLTLLGLLAVTLGTRRAGTSDERNALEAAWKFPGLEWFDTSDLFTYVWLESGSGPGWQRRRVVRGGHFGGDSGSAVAADGSTVIAHGGTTAPDAVTLTNMNHGSNDANSRLFTTRLWQRPGATSFRVRNIDNRDDSWAGAQQVRFDWVAVWNGI